MPNAKKLQSRVVPIIGRITVCFVLIQPSWILVTLKGNVCIKYILFLHIVIFYAVVKSEETCVKRDATICATGKSLKLYISFTW